MTQFEMVTQMIEHLRMVHGRDVHIETFSRQDGRPGTIVWAYRDGVRIDARLVVCEDEGGSCPL